MAKYDQGGGCPCGLMKDCDCDCENVVEQRRRISRPIRNELLEAVIDKEFDGDTSAMRTFMCWLESRVTGRRGPEGWEWHHMKLRNIRSTYADWMEVQRGGGLP